MVLTSDILRGIQAPASLDRLEDLPPAKHEEDLSTPAVDELVREFARSGARLRRRTRRAEAARAVLEPFFQHLRDRKRSWFKRGDVARVLGIEPKEAGKLLQDAACLSILEQPAHGWWHILDRLPPAPNMFQSTPQQENKVYNVFGD
mgnify:CR=1 FL=1